MSRGMATPLVTKAKRERLIAIRDALIKHEGDITVPESKKGLMIKELAEATDIPGPTMYRLLDTGNDKVLMATFGIVEVFASRPRKWRYSSDEEEFIRNITDEAVAKEREVLSTAKAAIAESAQTLLDSQKPPLKWWEESFLEAVRVIFEGMSDEDIAANFDTAINKATMEDYQQMIVQCVGEKDASKLKRVFSLAIVTPSNLMFGRD